MAVKVSSQDRRDLDKFTKFLAYKIVQVVVQSRSGEKIKTQSRPQPAGSDWFNLSIPNEPEVSDMTRCALDGRIPSVGTEGMCVEISIKTSEGDTMVLELWYLEMTDQIDSNNCRVGLAVYNRMSVMLKSLISISRITPAHKLSSLQGPGSFVVCYRVYMGEPPVVSLGEKYGRIQVGRAETPIGTLILSVAYRTQMTIPPQKTNKEGMFMVKSDHFNPDMSPKCHLRHTAKNNVLNVNEKSVMEELADACEDCNDEANKCTNGNFQTTKGCNNGTKDEISNGNTKKTAPVTSNCETHTKVVSDENAKVSFSDCMRVGAFVDQSKQLTNTDYIVPETGFVNLLSTTSLAEKTASRLNSLNNKKQNEKQKLTEPDAVVVEEVVKEKDLTDDFVMIDLKPPFACSRDDCDLTTFFKDCRAAPELASFNEQPTFADQVNELGPQLEKFETSVPDLDQFVQTLCSDETSK